MRSELICRPGESWDPLFNSRSGRSVGPGFRRNDIYVVPKMSARHPPPRLISSVRQVERIDRPPHLGEGQLAVIGGADADPGAIDDRLGYLAEPGAPMYPALQHHIALLHRVDAEGQQAVEIIRLDMARDQRDLDPAGIEDDTRPHIHQHAPPHRPLVTEPA